MMRKLVLTLAILMVVVLAVGGYWYWKKQSINGLCNICVGEMVKGDMFLFDRNNGTYHFSYDSGLSADKETCEVLIDPYSSKVAEVSDELEFHSAGKALGAFDQLCARIAAKRVEEVAWKRTTVTPNYYRKFREFQVDDDRQISVYLLQWDNSDKLFVRVSYLSEKMYKERDANLSILRSAMKQKNTTTGNNL